jgi:cobalt/nickel transport system permease protein
MSDLSREQAFAEIVAARRLRPPGQRSADKTLRQITAFFSAVLFREEIALRPGILQGVDARARLLAALVFLISVSLVRSIPGLLAHAVLPLGALALSRIRPAEFLRAGFLLALTTSALMAAPAALNVVTPGEVILPLFLRTDEWRYGPYVLPEVIGISREGMLTAATFLLRVLSSVAAVLWLTLATRWVDLLRALRSLRLPATFLQIVGMTVRYLHVFHRHSEEVHLGKKSRSVCRTRLADEQAWVASRIASAWERGLHLMEEVVHAMTARGFRGEARFLPDARFQGPEWALLATVALYCVAAQFA